jgi:hypothetical protein
MPEGWKATSYLPAAFVLVRAIPTSSSRPNQNVLQLRREDGSRCHALRRDDLSRRRRRYS